MSDQREIDLAAARLAVPVIAAVDRRVGETEGARRADVLAAVAASFGRDDFEIIHAVRRVALKRLPAELPAAAVLTALAEHLHAEARAS